MKLNVFPAAMVEKGQMEIFDDFPTYVDLQTWTKTLTGGGTAGIQANTAGGILQLISTTTLNSGALISSTNACFQYLKNRPWYVEAFINYVEASTNNAMLCFGLSSVATNVLLQDTTGIPATSFSGALIYKQQGDTVWRAISSNSTTQTLNKGQQTTQPTTSTDQTALRIEARDVDGSNYEMTFFINDAPLLDTTTHRPVKHTVAIAGASAMKLVALMKSGTTVAETLNIDYLAGFQRRPQ